MERVLVIQLNADALTVLAEILSFGHARSHSLNRLSQLHQKNVEFLTVVRKGNHEPSFVIQPVDTHAGCLHISSTSKISYHIRSIANRHSETRNQLSINVARNNNKPGEGKRRFRRNILPSFGALVSNSTLTVFIRAFFGQVICAIIASVGVDAILEGFAFICRATETLVDVPATVTIQLVAFWTDANGRSVVNFALFQFTQCLFMILSLKDISH